MWIMQCRQFLAVRVEPTSRSVSLCSLQRSSTSRRGENLVREKDLRYTWIKEESSSAPPSTTANALKRCSKPLYVELEDATALAL